jgi:two-component system chemotaxis response regulator CheB
MINESPGLRVVGEARDGHEAVLMVESLKPDVISMDINMPRMDGLEATRRIMTKQPTPVVVVSALVESDIDLSFQAIQAGALAVVEKPPDRNSPAFPEKQRQLVKTLVAMAGVKVIHRRKTEDLNGSGDPKKTTQVTKQVHIGPEVIAIGASAGGPSALSKLLAQFPSDLPVPILIAQHMPPEFITGLARWLNKMSPLEVKVAQDGVALKPGVVNLSPGTCHLAVSRKGTGLVTRFVHELGPHRYQPSVDVLFDSVAQVCGANAIGLILTGMGEDGAAGMLAMRQAGAHTLAQDEHTSIVFGMPGAAIERGAVEQVLPLSEIAEVMVKLL